MTRSIQDATVVLASASPRRRELLAQLGIPVQVDPSDANEDLEPEWDAETAATRLAERKALQVASRHCGADLVLGADTVVVVGETIFGKPADPADAERMLKALSGRTHRVITGYCLIAGHGARQVSGAVTSHVTFGELDEETIARYVGTGEPLDKAGAYAIQGLAGAFVREIAGDYPNIVGLPLFAIVQALRQFGWHVI